MMSRRPLECERVGDPVATRFVWVLVNNTPKHLLTPALSTMVVDPGILTNIWRTYSGLVDCRPNSAISAFRGGKDFFAGAQNS